MSSRVFLERRARESQRVFEFIASWTPTGFRDLSGAEVKHLLLRDEEMALLRDMQRENLWKPDELQQLISALTYAWSAFGHAEDIEAGQTEAGRNFSSTPYRISESWLLPSEIGDA